MIYQPNAFDDLDQKQCELDLLNFGFKHLDHDLTTYEDRVKLSLEALEAMVEFLNPKTGAFKGFLEP